MIDVRKARDISLRAKNRYKKRKERFMERWHMPQMKVDMARELSSTHPAVIEMMRQQSPEAMKVVEDFVKE